MPRADPDHQQRIMVWTNVIQYQLLVLLSTHSILTELLTSASSSKETTTTSYTSITPLPKDQQNISSTQNGTYTAQKTTAISTTKQNGAHGNQSETGKVTVDSTEAPSNTHSEKDNPTKVSKLQNLDILSTSSPETSSTSTQNLIETFTTSSSEILSSTKLLSTKDITITGVIDSVTSKSSIHVNSLPAEIETSSLKATTITTDGNHLTGSRVLSETNESSRPKESTASSVSEIIFSKAGANATLSKEIITLPTTITHDFYNNVGVSGQKSSKPPVEPANSVTTLSTSATNNGGNTNTVTEIKTSITQVSPAANESIFSNTAENRETTITKDYVASVKGLQTQKPTNPPLSGTHSTLYMSQLITENISKQNEYSQTSFKSNTDHFFTSIHGLTSSVSERFQKTNSEKLIDEVTAYQNTRTTITGYPLETNSKAESNTPIPNHEGVKTSPLTENTYISSTVTGKQTTDSKTTLSFPNKDHTTSSDISTQTISPYTVPSNESNEPFSSSESTTLNYPLEITSITGKQTYTPKTNLVDSTTSDFVTPIDEKTPKVTTISKATSGETQTATHKKLTTYFETLNRTNIIYPTKSGSSENISSASTYSVSNNVSTNKRVPSEATTILYTTNEIAISSPVTISPKEELPDNMTGTLSTSSHDLKHVTPNRMIDSNQTDLTSSLKTSNYKVTTEENISTKLDHNYINTVENITSVSSLTPHTESVSTTQNAHKTIESDNSTIIVSSSSRVLQTSSVTFPYHSDIPTSNWNVTSRERTHTSVENITTQVPLASTTMGKTPVTRLTSYSLSMPVNNTINASATTVPSENHTMSPTHDITNANNTTIDIEQTTTATSVEGSFSFETASALGTISTTLSGNLTQFSDTTTVHPQHEVTQISEIRTNESIDRTTTRPIQNTSKQHTRIPIATTDVKNIQQTELGSVSTTSSYSTAILSTNDRSTNNSAPTSLLTDVTKAMNKTSEQMPTVTYSEHYSSTALAAASNAAPKTFSTKRHTSSLTNILINRTMSSTVSSHLRQTTVTPFLFNNISSNLYNNLTSVTSTVLESTSNLLNPLHQSEISSESKTMSTMSIYDQTTFSEIDSSTPLTSKTNDTFSSSTSSTFTENLSKTSGIDVSNSKLVTTITKEPLSIKHEASTANENSHLSTRSKTQFNETGLITNSQQQNYHSSITTTAHQDNGFTEITLPNINENTAKTTSRAPDMSTKTYQNYNSSLQTANVSPLSLTEAETKSTQSSVIIENKQSATISYLNTTTSIDTTEFVSTTTTAEYEYTRSAIIPSSHAITNLNYNENTTRNHMTHSSHSQNTKADIDNTNQPNVNISTVSTKTDETSARPERTTFRNSNISPKLTTITAFPDSTAPLTSSHTDRNTLYIKSSAKPSMSTKSSSISNIKATSSPTSLDLSTDNGVDSTISSMTSLNKSTTMTNTSDTATKTHSTSLSHTKTLPSTVLSEPSTLTMTITSSRTNTSQVSGILSSSTTTMGTTNYISRKGSTLAYKTTRVASSKRASTWLNSNTEAPTTLASKATHSLLTDSTQTVTFSSQTFTSSNTNSHKSSSVPSTATSTVSGKQSATTAQANKDVVKTSIHVDVSSKSSLTTGVHDLSTEHRQNISQKTTALTSTTTSDFSITTPDTTISSSDVASVISDTSTMSIVENHISSTIFTKAKPDLYTTRTTGSIHLSSASLKARPPSTNIEKLSTPFVSTTTSNETYTDTSITGSTIKLSNVTQPSTDSLLYTTITYLSTSIANVLNTSTHVYIAVKSSASNQLNDTRRTLSTTRIPVSSTPKTTTVVAPPALFPIQIPNLGNAIYRFTFTMKIEANFKESMNTDEKLKAEIREKLNNSIFKGINDIGVEISFSKGSVICNIKTNIPKPKRNSTHTIEDYIDFIKNNTRATVGRLNTSIGTIDTKAFIENVVSTADAFHSSANKCAYLINTCDVEHLHVCKNDGDGVCIHKCDTDQNVCGQHGACFFDLRNNVTACTCMKTTYTVYYGDKCEQSTVTLTYVLAMSLGIGGAVLLILLAVIICLCCKARRKDSSTNHSIYDGSDWEYPGHDVTLKDLSFRGSLRAEPFNTNYYRARAYNSEAYQPVFESGDRRLYFPDSERGSTSTSRVGVIDETTVPSYSTIDVRADYSIRRPRVSSRPAEAYSGFYDLTSPETSPRTPTAPIVDMKTTL